MKIKATLLITTLVLALQPAFCQEETAPVEMPTTPSPAQVAVAAPPQAQQAIEGELRDPFWPVGYWPPRKGSAQDSTTNQVTRVSIPGRTNTTTVVKETVIQWPELKVKGLIKQPDGSYIAMIEGVKNIIEAGQTIQMTRNGIIFSWKVKEISKKGIIQQKLDYKPARR